MLCKWQIVTANSLPAAPHHNTVRQREWCGGGRGRGAVHVGITCAVYSVQITLAMY
ncbi:hypothetical protein J6590_068418 [Homalodisca vitripennis]|nr:hypothetical protein J6590_068418 [Homalodisca vitripennis]